MAGRTVTSTSPRTRTSTAWSATTPPHTSSRPTPEHPPYKEMSSRRVRQGADLTKVRGTSEKMSRQTADLSLQGGGGEAAARRHGQLAAGTPQGRRRAHVAERTGLRRWTCPSTNDDQPGSRYLMKAKSQGGVSVPVARANGGLRILRRPRAASGRTGASSTTTSTRSPAGPATSPSSARW